MTPTHRSTPHLVVRSWIILPVSSITGMTYVKGHPNLWGLFDHILLYILPLIDMHARGVHVQGYKEREIPNKITFLILIYSTLENTAKTQIRTQHPHVPTLITRHQTLTEEGKQVKRTTKVRITERNKAQETKRNAMKWVNLGHGAPVMTMVMSPTRLLLKRVAKTPTSKKRPEEVVQKTTIHQPNYERSRFGCLLHPHEHITRVWPLHSVLIEKSSRFQRPSIRMIYFLKPIRRFEWPLHRNAAIAPL